MVWRGRLLAQLQLLAPSAPEPGSHRALARRLAELKLKPLGHRPILLPGGTTPSWWPAVLEEAERLLPGHGAPALAALIDPVRAYELRATEGHRGAASLTAVQGAGAPLLLVARLVVPVHSGRT